MDAEILASSGGRKGGRLEDLSAALGGDGETSAEIEPD